MNENLEDDDENRDKNKTIKEQSPFTEIFKSLEDTTFSKSEIEEANSNPNTKYFPEFITHLNSNFMPYVFIWASFTLKGMEITRLTNEIIESYNKFRKGLIKSIA